MALLLALPQGAALSEGELPTSMQKRKLLYSELSADQAVEIGRKLVKAERYSDALSFFEKSGRTEEIVKVAEKAIELGDIFLYEATLRVRHAEPQIAELNRLAEQAVAQEKLHFARRAFQLAGKPERAEEMIARLNELVAPPKPATPLNPELMKDADFDE